MSSKDTGGAAASEGGPRQDRSSVAREQDVSGKMENGLEMNKANKVSITDASEVAGRKDKGTGTGLLDKLTGKKS